eukprot:225505-Rhodomonas_salina.1
MLCIQGLDTGTDYQGPLVAITPWQLRATCPRTTLDLQHPTLSLTIVSSVMTEYQVMTTAPCRTVSPLQRLTSLSLRLRSQRSHAPSTCM